MEKPLAERNFIPHFQTVGQCCVNCKVSTERSGGRPCKAALGTRAWGREENDRNYQGLGLTRVGSGVIS